jgi:outer membrane lipoprotein-sorting protein
MFIKKFIKKVVVLLIVILIPSVVYAADISAEALIAKLKETQSLVKDLQADTKTVITSNISIPGAPSKGPQTVTQTGHIWQKGSNKSKVVITSPMKQITITNGSMMTMISPDTGQKVTQDLSKVQGAGGKGQGMDATKALDYFNLTVRKNEGGTGEAEAYVISGTPKEANQFLGRMDFFIDAEKYIPIRIAMYTPKGALMSLSEMEYEPVVISSAETVYVPKKIKSVVTMQMGSINTEMEYENIKVNQGIKESVFEAE